MSILLIAMLIGIIIVGVRYRNKKVKDNKEVVKEVLEIKETEEKTEEEKLYLDYKNPDFDKYHELLENENRYQMTKLVNEKRAEELFEINKNNAIKRFNYYKKLSEEK